ncbi:hypothetical protein [Leptolyngbya sp. BC1307]|uniref:hypothetical protein n=1 Tax=Leptolyngbya sp. BC1307 TaxID=2029589 RepID=UPI00197EDDCA|nr:hypothetical protein [Leptolyngbya sp. BC1307]
MAYFASDLLGPRQSSLQTDPFLLRTDPRPDAPPREDLRHILLGSPAVIQQTIHLLHRLNYAEPGLWSPTIAVEGQLVITPAQGEAMSLLRRFV